MDENKVEAEAIEENENQDSQEAEEEEAELIDPQDTLKGTCSQTKECAALNERLMECTNRVNSKKSTSETCSEELYDFKHCVDHCVAKSLFKLLK